MVIRKYFIITSLAALSFGIGFVLAPEFVGGIFGILLDEDGVMIARFFGALLVTVGIWFFLMRETEDAATIRAMLTGYLTGLVIGLINALTGTLSGTMNGLGWLIVVLYGGLALGATFFLFARSALQSASTSAR